MAKPRAWKRAVMRGAPALPPLAALGVLGAPWCFASSTRPVWRVTAVQGTALAGRPVQHVPPQRAGPPARRGSDRRVAPTAAGDAGHAHPPDRRAWAVWLSAALQFTGSLVLATLAGAPYTYAGESRRRAGPRWIWSFWTRLPLVLWAAYIIYPWLCRGTLRYFPMCDAFYEVITSLFAPIVSLIYAIIAGQTVVSLWNRLYSIRTLLNRELAALEILERKLPREDPAAQRLFAEHVVGIDKYAIQQGTIAPNCYNKLADLASLDSLKDNDTLQELLDNLADIRAERRATTEIGYPRSLWGTLRVCAIMLIGCFLLLTQGFAFKTAAEQRGIRIVFCLFVLTVFWVNHLCRDLAELNYGEFQIDADVLRQNTALSRLQRRASEVLGTC